MPIVKIVKQWRGHDPGTTPELTDERADELLASGHAVALTESVPIAAEQRQKQAKPKAAKPNVVPTSHAPIDDRSDRRAVDTDRDETSVTDDA